MFDACLWARGIISSALGPVYGACPGDIRICERGYEASYAPGARGVLPEEGVLSSIANASPYIRSLSVSKGCICVQLGKAFYDEAVQRVNECSAPDMPEDSDSMIHAALMRALTLAKKGGTGCPDDAETMRLVWLAFGITGFVEDRSGGRLAQRLRTVSGLTVSLGSRLSVDRRAELYSMIGGAAGAVARLVSYGMSYQEVL